MKKQILFLLLFCALFIQLSVTSFAGDETTHIAHPVCGSACIHVGTESHEDMEWIQLTQTNLSQYKYQTTGLIPGNYYLGEDITLTKNLVFDAVSVNLCLNGKTLTGVSGSSVITVSGGSLATITDCSSTITEGYMSSSLWKKGQSTSSYLTKVNLTGGVITGGSSTFGGGLNIASGVVHMYGGNIAGNAGRGTDRAFHAGGGVNNSDSFYLHGGTICGNCVSTSGAGGINGSYYVGSGGGIYNTGTFTMTGGSICYNYGDHNGNGGGIQSSGDFIMSGGSIYNNQQVMSGGGVANYGTFTMSGGDIFDNNSRYDGGGVYNYNSAFTMNGGTISGNIALDLGEGGGVYNTGTFLMHGGKIAGNTAQTTSYSSSYGGGIFNSGGASFTMTGGEVSGNTVKHASTVIGNALGGGVYNYGAFTLTGGKICDNTITIKNEGVGTALGGGVYINSSQSRVGTINISGAPEITGNTCDGISNNLYLLQESAVTVGTDTDDDGVTEYLTDGAVLYVTPSFAPTDDLPFVVTTAAEADYSQYFFSDDRNYQAVASGADDQQVVQMIIHFDHVYDHETVGDRFLAMAATCQKPATYFKSCFCGATGTETFVHGGIVDHRFTIYHSNNDASCTADGTKTAQCDYESCTETDTQPDVDSALGHSFTTYISNSNATCTADGTKTAKCDHDGCEITDTQVDTNSKRGHSFTTYVSNNDATCMADGTESAQCDYAGCKERDTRKDENSKIGHRFTLYTSNNDATCMTDGTESAVCDFEGCAETDTRTDVDSKTAHPFGTWVPVSAPSYIEEGEEKRVCTQEGCEAFETRVIPATGPALLEDTIVVHDQEAGTLILLNVPEQINVVFALYDDGQMIACSFRSDVSNTVSYVLPSGYGNLTAKVFFLTQSWQPIGANKEVVF